MALKKHLKQISQLVEHKMLDLLPSINTEPKLLLHEAMHYAVFTGGKRLRPFLTVVSASLFGVSEESSLRAAAAIEFVHTYSLIHDDLPAMDDDDFRRGMPSCHIKFGEDAAILAGDALLTLAFEIMCDHLTHADSLVRCELVSILSQAAGYNGMVGGQMLDILSDAQMSATDTIRMQRMKTGELFAAACEAGAVLGKASKNLRQSLKGYAHDLGIAFQLIDDIADQDLATGDVNAIKKAQKNATMLINQAISHLHVFEEKADPLRSLALAILKKI
jgi:farnesyl diphosphate synthase